MLDYGLNPNKKIDGSAYEKYLITSTDNINIIKLLLEYNADVNLIYDKGRLVYNSLLEDNERQIMIRSECQGICSKIFQSVGVSIPPTLRQI